MLVGETVAFQNVKTVLLKCKHRHTLCMFQFLNLTSFKVLERENVSKGIQQRDGLIEGYI